MAQLGNEMLMYYFDKDYIYIMVTFLLGKDSPCYAESLGKNNENWGLIRGTPTQIEPIVNLIYYLYNKTKTTPMLDVEIEKNDDDNLEPQFEQKPVFTL